MATHLLKAFQRNGVEAVMVNSRSLEGLEPDSDIIIIAVSDSAIGEVAANIAAGVPDFKGIAAHTAGSVAMDSLQPFFRNYGVFYPLQTFSKDMEIPDFRDIPVFVEGNSAETADTLAELAGILSDNVYRLDSEAREKLHLASVFACNFTNALYGVAHELLEETGVPFSALLPLVDRTAAKVHDASPADCQTGPARRGDKRVTDRHIQLLSSRPELAKLYELVSSIISSSSH